MTVDRDYVRRCVMSVVVKIAQGSMLTDYVRVNGDYGREIRLQDALNEGVMHLHEPFHDEHWEVVQRAFARYQANPPTGQIDDCCRKLLTLILK